MSHVAQDHGAVSPAKRSRGSVVRMIVLLAVVAGLFAAGLVPPVRRAMVDGLGAMLQWTAGLGVWGPVFVAGVYVVACVLLLPGSVLTLGAGVLFGPVTGTITVSIGSTLGAAAAFLVGRFLARGWVERRVASNPKFAAIDEAVGREGFKIVLLTRLSPIFPFNLLNYGYGLTKVKFWTYVLASWIGMIPGTIMFVYIGSGLGSLAKAVTGTQDKTPAQIVLFWAGLGVAVLVAVVVTRIARKALRDAVANEAGGETE